MSDSDLDWARGVIRGLVRKQQENPLSEVIVTKFYPLTLHSDSEVECPLPTFAVDDMQGVLEDSNGTDDRISGSFAVECRGG